MEAAAEAQVPAGKNCIKIGLNGKTILRDYLKRIGLSKTFSLTENQFSGKTYFYTIGPCWNLRFCRSFHSSSSATAEERLFRYCDDDEIAAADDDVCSDCCNASTF